MQAMTIKIALLATALILTGCVTKPENVTTSDPIIQKPSEALVIHQLKLTPSKNGNSTHATIDFTNQTGRELSYVMFKATAFDNKGHIVRANKSGAEHAFLRVAGPFSKDSRSGGQRWEKVWTQNRPACFAIEGAELIFSDSSVEEIKADEIALSTFNSCAVAEQNLATN
jgi:uncharacterized protein YcfL